MCVGFLYTLVVRRPFESLITDVSRKGMLLSFSVSMVKRIVGCWLLRCCKKPSTWSRSNIFYFSSFNTCNSGTIKGVSWKTMEVCNVKRKEEAEENLGLWLPRSIIEEFGGTYNTLVWSTMD